MFVCIGSLTGFGPTKADVRILAGAIPQEGCAFVSKPVINGLHIFNVSESKKRGALPSPRVRSVWALADETSAGCEIFLARIWSYPFPFVKDPVPAKSMPGRQNVQKSIGICDVRGFAEGAPWVASDLRYTITFKVFRLAVSVEN